MSAPPSHDVPLACKPDFAPPIMVFGDNMGDGPEFGGKRDVEEGGVTPPTHRLTHMLHAVEQLS